MQKQTSERGFSFIKFKDRYNHKCSLQKSSIATEDCIWLGIEDAEPQICVQNEGWKSVPFPEGTHFTTRMHLSQKNVKELLPYLVKFVETGEI